MNIELSDDQNSLTVDGVGQGVYDSNREQVEFRNQGKIQLTEAGALQQHRAYVELIANQTSQWD